MGNVLGNVAKVGDFGLDAPVPLVLEQQGVVVEEARSQVSNEVIQDAVVARMLKGTHPE